MIIHSIISIDDILRTKENQKISYKRAGDRVITYRDNKPVALFSTNPRDYIKSNILK